MSAPVSAAHAITTEGLVKIDRTRKTTVRALDGLDLEVKEGSILGLLGLLGLLGAGKTNAVRRDRNMSR